MIVVFCTSFLSVSKAVSVIDNSIDKVLIITFSDDLSIFFNKLYPKFEVLQFNKYKIGFYPLKKILNIFRLLKHKRFLEKKLERIENTKVYFFFVAFCEIEAWMLKKLSRRNSLFYSPTVCLNYLPKDYSIRALFGQLFRYLFYAIVFEPLRSPQVTYYALSKHYLDALSVQYISLKNQKYTNLIRKINGIIPDLGRRKILILSGGIADQFVEQSEYIRKIDQIVKIFEEKYGKDLIAIKAHPRFPQLYSKEKTLFQIPESIPASLFIGHFKIILGYSTGTLVEAAQLGMTPISLLRLFKPIDKLTQKASIEYLKENTKCKKILFPRTIKELELSFFNID